MKTLLLSILLVATNIFLLPVFAEDAKKTDGPVVGHWNDGLVGENIGLSIYADGTGEFISLGSFHLGWQYEPRTEVLTITRAQDEAGHLPKPFTLLFRYKPESDSLVLLTTNEKDHAFYRVSKAGEFYRGKGH